MSLALRHAEHPQDRLRHLVGKGRGVRFGVLFEPLQQPEHRSAHCHQGHVGIRDVEAAGLIGGNDVASRPRGESAVVGEYADAGVQQGAGQPWESCYSSAQLLGGSTRFVLSTSGHIAALVNPPGNPKATYSTGDDVTSEPRAWLEDADLQQGTWWSDLDAWLEERGGGRRPAPAELGSDGRPVLAEAPGTYVFDR